MTVELLTKCLEIENWTRSLTLRGLEREEIVARIDEMYEPETEEEMEAYSEAIVYARLGVLN
jgi:proteasome assembly chaperone (PAC2) family protein